MQMSHARNLWEVVLEAKMEFPAEVSWGVVSGWMIWKAEKKEIG